MQSGGTEMSQKTILRSIEVDILIPDDEEKADVIDGTIGELSLFHHTYGYYAQGVDSTTAMLPAGAGEARWRYYSVDLRIRCRGQAAAGTAPVHRHHRRRR